MNRKILVVLGLLIVGGGISFLLKNGVGQESVETEVEIREEAVVVQEEEVVLTAKLEDVDGGRSSGTAFIARGANLKHGVEASLPELAGDTFYEGWLVKQKPSLEFFSTGEMLKDVEGKYVLEYESSELYEGYDFVVITLETKRDDIPEKHILEGTAK